MSGHAYFGEDVTKVKHISFYHNGEMKKIKRVWQYHNGVYRQVWTGASTVSYYDGNTLLGTEEVDEGNDVLRPQTIDTTKTGYTLYGWKASPDDSARLEQLLADGEPINLYAYYVPNTIVVASGTVSGSMGYTNYTENSKNAFYVAGGLGVTANRFYSAGDAEARANFTLNLNEYRQGTIEYWYYTGLGTDQEGWFDNVMVRQTQNTKLVTTNGEHTLYARGHCVANDSWTSTTLGVVSITLSDPIEWV